MPRYTAENSIGRVKTVFLDGVEIDNVIEADDDLGFAIVMDKETCDRKLVTGEVSVAFFQTKRNQTNV